MAVRLWSGLGLLASKFGPAQDISSSMMMLVVVQKQKGFLCEKLQNEPESAR